MAMQAGDQDQRAPADEAFEVKLAKSRDSDVWARWHDAYYPLIYRYAYARLANPDDAEDVAAQVFLEAIRSIDRFQYRGQPVVAWFYGIAGHVVSRRYREAGRSNRSLEADDISIPAAQNETEMALDRLSLASVLEQLKEEHREVLILRFMLDLPTSEVAEMIGKSEHATYSLQVRALQAARRIATAPDLRAPRRAA